MFRKSAATTVTPQPVLADADFPELYRQTDATSVMGRDVIFAPAVDESADENWSNRE